MADRTYWESFKAESEQIVDKIRDLIHEGNVRTKRSHFRTRAGTANEGGIVLDWPSQ